MQSTSYSQYLREFQVGEWANFYVKYEQHKQHVTKLYLKVRKDYYGNNNNNILNGNNGNNPKSLEYLNDNIELIQQRVRQDMVKVDEFFIIQLELCQMMKDNYDKNNNLNQKYSSKKRGSFASSTTNLTTLTELLSKLFHLKTYVWQNYTSLSKLIEKIDSVLNHVNPINNNNNNNHNGKSPQQNNNNNNLNNMNLKVEIFPNLSDGDNTDLDIGTDIDMHNDNHQGMDVNDDEKEDKYRGSQNNRKKRETISANFKKYPGKTPTVKHNKKYEDEEEEIEIEHGNRDGTPNPHHHHHIDHDDLIIDPIPEQEVEIPSIQKTDITEYSINSKTSNNNRASNKRSHLNQNNNLLASPTTQEMTPPTPPLPPINTKMPHGALLPNKMEKKYSTMTIETIGTTNKYSNNTPVSFDSPSLGTNTNTATGSEISFIHYNSKKRRSQMSVYPIHKSQRSSISSINNKYSDLQNELKNMKIMKNHQYLINFCDICLTQFYKNSSVQPNDANSNKVQKIVTDYNTNLTQAMSRNVLNKTLLINQWFYQYNKDNKTELSSLRERKYTVSTPDTGTMTPYHNSTPGTMTPYGHNSNHISTPMNNSGLQKLPFQAIPSGKDTDEDHVYTFAYHTPHNTAHHSPQTHGHGNNPQNMHKWNNNNIAGIMDDRPITAHQNDLSNCNHSDHWPEFSETRIDEPEIHNGDILMGNNEWNYTQDYEHQVMSEQIININIHNDGNTTDVGATDVESNKNSSNSSGGDKNNVNTNTNVGAQSIGMATNITNKTKVRNRKLSRVHSHKIKSNRPGLFPAESRFRPRMLNSSKKSTKSTRSSSVHNNQVMTHLVMKYDQMMEKQQQTNQELNQMKNQLRNILTPQSSNMEKSYIVPQTDGNIGNNPTPNNTAQSSVDPDDPLQIVQPPSHYMQSNNHKHKSTVSTIVENRTHSVVAHNNKHDTNLTNFTQTQSSLSRQIRLGSNRSAASTVSKPSPLDRLEEEKSSYLTPSASPNTQNSNYLSPSSAYHIQPQINASQEIRFSNDPSINSRNGDAMDQNNLISPPIPNINSNKSLSDYITLSIVMVSYGISVGLFPFIFKYLHINIGTDDKVQPWLYAIIVSCQWPIYLSLMIMVFIYNQCKKCYSKITQKSRAQLNNVQSYSNNHRDHDGNHKWRCEHVECPIHPDIESNASLFSIYRYQMNFCDYKNLLENNNNNLNNDYDDDSSPESEVQSNHNYILCNFIFSKHGIQMIILSGLIDCFEIILQLNALSKLEANIYIFLSVISFTFHIISMFSIFDSNRFCTKLFLLISINAVQIGLSYWYYDMEIDGKNKFNKFLYGTLSLIGYQILSSSKIYFILNNKYMMQKDIISGCNISYFLSLSFLINIIQFVSIIGFIHIFQDDTDVLYTNFNVLTNPSISLSMNQTEIFGITLSFCIILIVSKMFMKIVKYIMFNKQNNNKILFLLLNTYFSDNNKNRRNTLNNSNNQRSMQPSPNLSPLPSLGRDFQNKSISAQSQSTTAYYLPQYLGGTQPSFDESNGFNNTNNNGNLSTVSILDIISRTVWIILFFLILDEKISIILLACWTLLILVIYISYKSISESLFSNHIFSFLTFLHNSSSILSSDIDSILITMTYKFYANMKLYLHIVRNRRQLLPNYNSNSYSLRRRPRIRNKTSTSTRGSNNNYNRRYLQRTNGNNASDDDEDEAKLYIPHKTTIDSIQINDISSKNNVPGNGTPTGNKFSIHAQNTYSNVDNIRNITPPPNTNGTPQTVNGNNTITSAQDLNIIQYRGNTFTDTVNKLDNANHRSTYSHGNFNNHQYQSASGGNTTTTATTTTTTTTSNENVPLTKRQSLTPSTTIELQTTNSLNKRNNLKNTENLNNSSVNVQISHHQPNQQKLQHLKVEVSNINSTFELSTIESTSGTNSNHTHPQNSSHPNSNTNTNTNSSGHHNQSHIVDDNNPMMTEQDAVDAVLDSQEREDQEKLHDLEEEKQSIIRLNNLQSSHTHTHSHNSATETYHISGTPSIGNGLYHGGTEGHDNSTGNTTKVSSPSLSTPTPVPAPIEYDNHHNAAYHKNIIGLKNRYSVKDGVLSHNVLIPPQSHPNTGSVLAGQEESHTFNHSSMNTIENISNELNANTPTNGTNQSSYNDNSVAL